MNINDNVKQLFEQYSDMIYRIALSYGNSVCIAEDVVQDVFLRYLKKSPHFENDEHEKAWFIRVTVNRCKSIASSAWMQKVHSLEETPESVAQTVFASMQTPEQELYEILSGLPPKYRIVLYLRYYEEYPVKEIAGLLGITPNLVSARLLRAKKLLKQELLKETEVYHDETGAI